MIVKVRFQDPMNAGKYTSTLDAFTRIVREERIQGLFRGIAAPMVRVACTVYPIVYSDILGCRWVALFSTGLYLAPTVY